MHQSARDGQPITRLIGQVLTAEDGTFRRGKGGKPIRSKTKMVDNPATRYVRGLSKYQLAQLIGINPEPRENRRNALAAFEQLDADGIIELHRDGRGKNEQYHIFGRNVLVDAQADEFINH